MGKFPRFVFCCWFGILAIVSIEAFHFPDKAQLELSDVLNKNCGHSEYEDRERPAEGRLQESPWLVLFFYPDEPDESRTHFCHGTLITPSFVLSTAVCSNNFDLNRTEVVLGEYDLSTEQDCEGTRCSEPVQKRLVQNVFVHHAFNADTFDNDIAMVKLDREVLLTSAVHPICLPLIKFEIGSVNLPNVYNTLWTTRDRPQQFWMKYVELPKCVELVGKQIRLVDGQICARSFLNRTIDLIGGAGSALEVEYHNRMYQVAMLSIGILDSPPGVPYVYVDIPRYVRWIHDTISNNIEQGEELDY
ncbi:chymotrypsin-like protease CTRL-1 [Uranotaenia lowii]|uniref:chymotrypsin-like protease CTRL-1 n=1 Tax=Uranotaenia lowii TaxID=190385 RepID=UPI0024796609|nr:chymotrypsin-like protease CTRL-1 [Uranotaenia lowii]